MRTDGNKEDQFLYNSKSHMANHKRVVDLLIINGHIVTMDKHRRIFKSGAIAVKDGVIVDIGPSTVLQRRYIARKKVNADMKIVMPGLIDAHTHAPMTLLRGYADDLPFEEWWEQYIQPAEEKYMNPQTIHLGTLLAIAEMIHSGITTFNDMYFFENEVATAAKKTGMRAVVAETLMDHPVLNAKTPEEGLRYTEFLLKRWQNDPLITIAVSAFAPYACSPDLLIKAKELSDLYGVTFHINLSETKQEVEEMIEETGYTPVGYVNSLGVLGENVVAVHCVYLTPNDVKLFAVKKAGVAHTPRCDAKFANGVAPVPELLDKGIKVGLGSSSPAGNNKLNIFEEIGMAALIHKAVSCDPTVVDAYTALKMATIDAAKVLMMEDRIGSLEKGKRADIILIDGNRANTTPTYNIYSNLVYALNSASVETVIIEGKIIMDHYTLLTMDEEEVIQKVNCFAEQIKYDMRKKP